MREEITCNHFLDALGDPDFALKIRERQPADLDSALRIALQLEVWKQDMNRHRDTARPERGRNVREISNRKPTEPTLEAMHKDLERVKKYLEFDRGPPRNPNSGGFSSDRRPDLIRHTAPSAYHAGRAPGSAATTAWSSSGQNAAGRGQRPSTYHPSVSARPPIGNGYRNGNFYRPPDPNSGCFYCGDPAHRAGDCTVSSASQQQPEPPPTPRPQPPTQQQPQRDVRPVKDHSNKQEKTCIWVKYREHKLSALIDTGSDISIAGESLADNMGWKVHPHHVKEVSVANNDTMTILGAAHVTLSVAGHDVESEILIASELDGLILGIDWLRSLGSIWWDFDQERIKFGRRDWVKLRKEATRPSKTDVYKSGPNRRSDKRGRSSFEQAKNCLPFAKRDRRTDQKQEDVIHLRRRRHLFKKALKDKGQHTTITGSITNCRQSLKPQHPDTESPSDKDIDNRNTMTVERPDETTMSSLLSHLPHRTRKFLEENTSPASKVRLLESGNVRPVPTMCAWSLWGREGTGNRADIIINEIKADVRENSCVGKEGRQRPGVAQNENFLCVRRCTVIDAGEGHQKQEAQSVNPSVESGETSIFEEEGHQKSVNSPVEYNTCCSSTLFPVSQSGSRPAVVKTEFPGEDRTSAKVDQIQHSYLGPEVVSDCDTQHQVIRFDIKRQKHQQFSSEAAAYVSEDSHRGSSMRQSSDFNPIKGTESNGNSTEEASKQFVFQRHTQGHDIVDHR